MSSGVSQAMISANTCAFASTQLQRNYSHKRQQSLGVFRMRAAASSDDADCNTEECAPDKEVGKVSMEWLAGEKTKVLGTYPPRRRPWTGYVEKDTAGQTNIYSVEPPVYVAESAISSGTAGSSAEGSENTAAIAGGLALIFIAATSSILLQVGKNSPQVQTAGYSGPSLSYYINKFKPQEIVRALPPATSETSISLVPEASAPAISQARIESETQPEASTSVIDVAS